MLNANQVRFLQALALDTKPRAESLAAAHFAGHFGLGLRIGRRYEYTPNDAIRASDLLASMGLESAGVLGVSDRAGAVLRPGLSEKSGTLAPHADSVAFQILSAPAMAGGHPIPETNCGYQVGAVDEVASVNSELVLVVENFESFRQIRRYSWLMEMLPEGKSVLVVFRGDPRFRIDDAQRAMGLLTAPVWGFFDFDPTGLLMCASLKQLDRLVLPPWAVLEQATVRAKRDDLYHQQIGGASRILDACQHADIQTAWALLRRLRKGLPQEWMRDIQKQN